MSVTTVGLSASDGIILTASASLNTKGSYATVSGATPVEAVRVIVSLWEVSRAAVTNRDFLVDLSTGGAPDEVVLFGNLAVSSTQTHAGHARYDFPCLIPAGTVLRARVQSTATNATLYISVILISGTGVARTVTTYGADTTDSGGTNVDPGTTINTKGLWAEITPSCAAMEAVIVRFGNAAATLGLGTLRANGRNFFVDVGTGALGAEVAVLENLSLHQDGASSFLTPDLSPLIPFTAPAATRLVARAQMNGANPTATDRQFDLILYGVSAGHSTAYPPGVFDLFAACAEPPAPPGEEQPGIQPEGVEIAVTEAQRQVAAQTLHPAQDCLTKLGTRLHDRNVIWATAELLDWYNDGYRRFLDLSQAVRRFRAFPVPGRAAFAITREWEDRHCASTQIRKPTHAAAGGYYQAGAQWEIEAMPDLTPTATLQNITQEWERAHVSDSVEPHYRFAFPRNHERVTRLTWHGKRLVPVAVRDLDELETEWWQQVGLPQYWTSGTGRIKTVELYQIDTTYQAAYALLGEPFGLPRTFTGTRTWAVEANPQFPGHSPRVWSYSYSSQGDAIALSAPHAPFTPRMAVTQTWELEYAEKPAWVWTIDFTMLDGVHTVTQPWEIGQDIPAGTTRGMWPWERADPLGGYAATIGGHADDQISLANFHPQGMPVFGIRMTLYTTTVAGVTWYTTQPWEVDMLNGVATASLRVGATVGTGYFEGRLGYAPPPAVGLGTWRMVTSPDRQYLPIIEDQTTGVLRGRPVELNSDADSVMALEVVLPDTELTEQGSPALIPPQLEKYICFYMLGKAFARVGEGHNAILADHYMRRFKRGVDVFMRLGDVAHRDRILARGPAASVDGRPPRVRLPSTFERIG